jgi:predicted ribosome quality control (RQC) complex YloA/Tae2 family protein
MKTIKLDDVTKELNEKGVYVYINNHTIEQGKKRIRGVNFKKINKIEYAFQKYSNGYEINKVRMKITFNNFIGIGDLYERDGVYYLKINTILKWFQFNISKNLSFGAVVKPLKSKINIKVNEIIFEDRYFDEKYNKVLENVKDYKIISDIKECRAEDLKLCDVIIDMNYGKTSIIKIGKKIVGIK